MKPARNDTDLELPATVRSAVHTTAAYAPPLPPDLAGVRTRGRRAALSVAAAAVAVLAAGAAVPALQSVTSQGDSIAGGPSGRHPIPLWQHRDELPVTEGLPPGRHVPGSSGEIAAQLRTV